MPKTIAFIGSGAIGSALARLAVAADLDVIMSNSRGPDTLADLVAELGDHARAATPVEAARAADLVVATIPFGLHTQLPAQALAGKIVIDTMNYYPARDGRIEELDNREITSSAMLQRHLADSRVVKALHNLEYIRLFTAARPAGSPERSALPIAGDAVAAKAEVTRFMDAIGYDAVDVGTLADSWRCEPLTPIYVHPYISEPPKDMTPEQAERWFLHAPPATVTADQVRALTAKATRTGRVGGQLDELPPGMARRSG